MQAIESAPCPGLSVPVVSVLDEDGGLVESDQRALVRFVVQESHAADVVFAAGTTGEWDKLPSSVCQRVIQVCCEEVAKANAQLPDRERPLEAWAGVSAHSRDETLENLDFALAHGADAVVLAPLSVRGIDDPVRFVSRDVAVLLARGSRRVPLYLYDNAEIAVDPRAAHLRADQLKALAELDFVRGIKVSASLEVVDEVLRAVSDLREREAFGVYVGNAPLIFRLFQQGEVWRERGVLPVGVVAGPANALPREWARAWQVCRAGDAERMNEVKRVIESFQRAMQAVGDPTIACLKRALRGLGVVSSDAVARGTPELAGREAERFDAAFAGVRELARELLAEPWVTRAPAALGAALS